MDPAYATTDPSGLYVTTSGLAIDTNPTIDPGSFVPAAVQPVLYDPSTMGTPYVDPLTGLHMAVQLDGSVLPVAIGSDTIMAPAGGPIPGGLLDLFASGVQSAGLQLQRLMNPNAAHPGATVPGGGLLAGMTPGTMLLLGVGAYFLLRKKR